MNIPDDADHNDYTQMKPKTENEEILTPKEERRQPTSNLWVVYAFVLLNIGLLVGRYSWKRIFSSVNSSKPLEHP